MKPIFLIISLLYFSSTFINAQDKPEIVSVKGEFTVQWYVEKESKEEAEKRAEERASVNALEKAFGTVIVQGNSTYIKNVNTGKKVETTTTFSMIGNTTVGGEIVEIVSKKFKVHEKKYRRKREKVTDKFIECKIVVNARKLTDAKINFQASPLAAPMKKAVSSSYRDGDDIYFYFRTPVSGYVSIYVDITGQGITQRILPYSDVPPKHENGMKVEADKDYIFFSTKKDHNYYAEDYVIPDEIVASPDEAHEFWRFFIIFSKTPLNKPNLKKGITKENLTENERNDKFTVPKALNSEDFQRWLINNLSYRDDFQRKIIDVTVEK